MSRLQEILATGQAPALGTARPGEKPEAIDFVNDYNKLVEHDPHAAGRFYNKHESQFFPPPTPTPTT